MNGDKQYWTNLLLLRIYCGKLIPVLDVFTSGYIDDDAQIIELDKCYKHLYTQVQVLLQRDGLSTYKTAFPELYDSLVSVDDVARFWGVGREMMLNLVNRLESVWKVQGAHEFNGEIKLSESSIKLLAKTDKIIIETSASIKTQIKDKKAKQTMLREVEGLLEIWPQANQPTPKSLKLEPSSYDAANGVLVLNGHHIHVVKQPSRKGKGVETKQAYLLRLLFKDVNSMQNGIPMRTVLSVKATDFNSKKRKLVKNYVADINKKINAENLGEKPIELIVHNQLAIMVNSLYL
jgi:hypothetical protein